MNIVSTNRMAVSCITKKWNRDIFLSSKVMWTILVKLKKYRFAHLRLPSITSSKFQLRNGLDCVVWKYLIGYQDSREF